VVARGVHDHRRRVLQKVRVAAAGCRPLAPSGPSGHLPTSGEEKARPLRPFGPPPHEWGGKGTAPPALRATSPRVGRRLLS
jgi:hypothetical protein